jgi:site-specific DNA-methyltransferase (adenine-specific)
MTANNQDFTLSAESPADLRPVMGVGSTALLGSVSLSNEDCMALMRRYPDKHFDLAIVDPPYGINVMRAEGKPEQRGNQKASRRDYGVKEWDAAIPPMEYFAELGRVSRHQIIWGGNYFPLSPSRCWVVWDKLNGDNGYADCELAWASFDKAVRKFEFRWAGMLQGNMAEKEDRIHPTQKPVALYRWLLENYAKPGMKILDTHLGSGSHAIACHYAGMHLTACEIDADYFAAAQERIARETRQTTLF